MACLCHTTDRRSLVGSDRKLRVRLTGARYAPQIRYTIYDPVDILGRMALALLAARVRGSASAFGQVMLGHNYTLSHQK